MSELRMIASTKTMNIIKEAVATDDQYASLRTQIAVGWPDRSNDLTSNLREFRTFADDLTVCDDLICKGTRFVIPGGACQAMLERLHSSHIGTNGCIRRAREVIFYPGIVAAIRALVQRCEICRSRIRCSKPKRDATFRRQTLEILGESRRSYIHVQ